MDSSSSPSLRVCERGLRSTLYVSKEGDRYRQYHDTGEWESVPCVFDEGGVARCAGNRKLEAVVREAFAEQTYRGGGVRSARPPPPHLRRALACLTRRPRSVEAMARECGVEVSTAWSYACKVVNQWPSSHQLARRLVYPPLLEACDSLPIDGTLSDVLSRLDAAPPLRGDQEWRRTANRLSHLRLARMCVDASRV